MGDQSLFIRDLHSTNNDGTFAAKTVYIKAVANSDHDFSLLRLK
ncbi:Uncharacterised protein [Vibrio cholerae]|uniref:Uncharacterized protein n=1 Tax=Vibrio cholerae TaxID=666 RepID=A0A655XI61_VIBCL|nr:Uncharacterised protein [Vibrio cholerae]